MPVKMDRFFSTARIQGGGAPRQAQVQLPAYNDRFVQAASNLGQQMIQYGREQEENELSQLVIERSNLFETKAREKENELLSLRGKNANGLDKSASDFVNSLTEEAIAGVEDERAQAAIISQISTKRSSFLNRMYAHNRNEKNASYLSAQRSRVQGLVSDFTAAPDPETEASILQNMGVTIRSLGKAQGLTEEQIEQSIAGQTSDAISSRAIYLAGSAPQAALEYYNQNESMILPDSRTGLRERIQGKIDRIEAKQEKARRDRRTLIVNSIPDAQAYLFETGDAKAMRNASVELRRIGFNDEADDVDRQIKASSMAFSVMERNGNKPFVEQLQVAESAFPITGLEGAADDVKARESLRKIINSNIKAFQKDPAGYVDEDVPKDISPERRVETRINLQKQMAQGLGGFTPNVLTAIEKDNIKNKWDGTEDSKQKLNLLRAIDSEYGAYSSSVYEESGIPLSAMVAVDLVGLNQSAETDAQLLITASTAKRTEIPQAEDLPPVDIKSAIYDSDVYGVYSKVAQIFSADARYNQSVAGLEQTLYNVIALTGETNKAKILDKYIGTIDDSDMLITYNKNMIDDDKIENYLDAQKGQIVDSLPENSFPRIAAQENTIWIDNPSGPGWALANVASQSLYRGIDGEPVTVTPEEILGKGGTTGKMSVEIAR